MSGNKEESTDSQHGEQQAVQQIKPMKMTRLWPIPTSAEEEKWRESLKHEDHFDELYGNWFDR